MYCGNTKINNHGEMDYLAIFQSIFATGGRNTYLHNVHLEQVQDTEEYTGWNIYLRSI